MNNHLQACEFCPKYEHGDGTQKSHTGCEIYADVTWVNRRGGCGMFPFRDLPQGMSYLDGKILTKGRTGQQKQKHADRNYHSKNDGKRKYRIVSTAGEGLTK